MKALLVFLGCCLGCSFDLLGQSQEDFDQKYAVLLSQMGQIDTVRLLATMATLEQEALSMDYSNGLSDLAAAKGHLYVSEGLKSVAFYQQSIEYARKGSDSSRVARGYGNLCNVFAQNEHYRDAIGYGTSAQHLLEEIVKQHPDRRNQIRLAELYLNMSVAYGHFKDETLTLDYANRAVQVHKRANPIDTLLLVASLKNLAAWYVNFADAVGTRYDSAFTCYSEAIRYLKVEDDFCHAPEIYLQIAAIKWNQENRLEGWEWQLKAERAMSKCEEEYTRAAFLWDANFQRAQWWLTEHQAAKALPLLRKLADDDFEYFVREDGLRLFAEAFELLSQHDSAAYYLKLALERSQRTFEKEQTDFNTITLERIKEQGLRKLEVESAKTKDAQNQNRMLWMGLLIALLASLLLGLSAYFINKQGQLREEQHQLKLNQMLSESETKFLEGQNEGRLSRLDQIYSILHSEYVPDLANVKRGFEALRKKLSLGLVPYEQSQDLYDQLSETTSKIRQLAQELSPHNQTTQHAVGGGLLDSLQQRVDIVNRQRQVNVQFHHTDLLINERFALDVRRIVIDLLENALKYAQATQIDISLIQDEDSLNIKVCDNGRGLPAGEQSTGTGLANMKRKIALYNGEGPIIETQPGQGTQIAIRFPIMQ